MKAVAAEGKLQFDIRRFQGAKKQSANDTGYRLWCPPSAPDGQQLSGVGGLAGGLWAETGSTIMARRSWLLNS
jgi:hypothetical protein